MRKEELLEQYQKKRHTGLLKLDREAAIISALPDGFEVEKVSGSWVTDDRSSGTIELIRAAKEVPDLMALFPPVPLSRVVMERGNHRTTSFYPTAAISVQWYEADDRVIRDAIYPALIQVKPNSSKGTIRNTGLLVKQGSDVEVEWFFEPEGYGVRIHMRAKISDPQPYYELVAPDGGPLPPMSKAHRMNSKWVARNVPRGEVRRTFMLGDDSPPYLTVWWWETEIGDSIAEVLDGPGRDV